MRRGDALRDAAALLRRRWWIVAACLLLIPGAVYLYSAAQKKTYEASVVLQPEDTGSGVPGGAPTGTEGNGSLLQFYAQTGGVASATVSRLPGPDRAFAGLSASVDKDTGWLTLTATAARPGVAVAAANAYYAALIQYLTVNVRRQFGIEIAAASHSLPLTSDPVERRIVTERIASLTALRDATLGPLRVVQPSQAGVASPHPVRNALLALLLAILIAPPLLVALEPLDRKLRKPADLERLGGAALLAGVPHAAFAAARPDLAADHAFERLRDSLIYLDPDRRPRTFAIISPLPGEGRTTVATGLAATFARGGRSVALVDADLTTPRVAAAPACLRPRVWPRSSPATTSTPRFVAPGVRRRADGASRRVACLPGPPSSSDRRRCRACSSSSRSGSSSSSSTPRRCCPRAGRWPSWARCRESSRWRGSTRRHATPSAG